MIHTDYNLALKSLLNQNSNPKWGLDRTKELLKLLGFENSWFKTVQIVGTNGKGSTSSFLESLLYEHGIRCGKFISPHLTSIRERFIINKKMISKEDFIESFNYIKNISLNMFEAPSFFECVLAMALYLFKKHEVKVAILEAGLGGRLDATTATNADILGVTSIDLDHQAILGKTLELIAKEKIMAARKDQNVFLSFGQDLKVINTIKEMQNNINFNLYYCDKIKNNDLSLKGEHQYVNAGLSLDLFKNLGFKENQDAIKKAFKNTFWPGRCEIFYDEVPILIDGAHNESGVKSFINYIKNGEFNNTPKILIFAATEGHNFEKIIEHFKDIKNIKKIYAYQSNNIRAINKNILYENLKNIYSTNLYNTFEEVKIYAKEHQGLIVAFGSLYAIGELRSKLTHMEVDEEMPNY